ncbi:MAG: VWA domain-containing protein [Oscillospiraceae bacterium]|nr:VWA domain-containing protein [Oscillospiraceae bacterium]
MPKVNHKKVRRLVTGKSSKITDRQFFTSRILAGHYEDMAAAQTRRYHYTRRIKVRIVWKPREPDLAHTDNSVIFINAGHPSITKKHRSRQERYDVVTGLFAHELGHVLYTDFLAAQTHRNFLRSYRWYPEPPVLTEPDDSKREGQLWAYAKADPNHIEMLNYISHLIANMVEDGYIEGRILAQFPGTLGYCLDQMRKTLCEDSYTMDEMVAMENDEEADWTICDTIFQNILSYSTSGIIKYGSVPKNDERIQAVFALIPTIDSALMSRSAKDRWRAVNLIMVRLWDYVVDYMDVCKRRLAEKQAAGVMMTASEMLDEMLKGLVGGSAIGSGTTGSVAEVGGGSVPLPNAAVRAAIKEALEAMAEESEESKDEEEGSGGSPSATEEENTPSTESENAEELSSTEDETSKQKTTSKEGGRFQQEQTESVSAPVGGETTYDENYQREHDANAAADIERLLDSMAERAAVRELESERLKELQEAAQNISYGDIHEGVSIKIHRIPEVDPELVEQYDTIAPPLIAISKRLQKSMLQQLQDQWRGGKQTGLMFGRRLDAHSLHRNDGKHFYKNSLPNEIPRIAVTYVADESGSMSYGDRSTYARAAAIVLYDFCDALRIPISVYGHSTGGNSVCLYSYAEFESYDADDRYRLMDISARNSNRDGAALRFAAEQLSKRPEEIKLLILVSDGQPADSGYYGSAAEEDLRGIQQEYKRKGIIFAAAAIGEDKQVIERIYGDAFMDITDLNQLPQKLTRLVGRYMKV